MSGFIFYGRANNLAVLFKEGAQIARFQKIVHFFNRFKHLFLDFFFIFYGPPDTDQANFVFSPRPNRDIKFV